MSTVPTKPRSHRRQIGGTAASIGLATLFLVGCAAGADSQPQNGAVPDGYPTIASTDFNGMFEIAEATIDGAPLSVGAAATTIMEFDVVTGAATVDLGCDRRLGSFTLADDMRASITLTGRIEIEPCTASAIDDALWELIDRLERWEPVNGGLRPRRC